MTTKIDYRPLSVDPSSHPRLADVLATFDEVKDAYSAAQAEAERLKKVYEVKRDMIVAEAHALDPTAQGFEVANAALDRPLRVSWVPQTRIDTKRLEAERPEIAEYYKVKSGYWMIKRKG